MRLDLDLDPYKIVLAQELKSQDHRMRREFADWALQMLANDPNFGQKIIFTDEAHFWLNGYVNKQNCRFWDAHNPQMFEEASMHPQRLTVWCGLWHGGIIGPYFFRNEEGVAVNVNGEQYRKMLTEFLWPELDSIDITEMWFQQDGATCHTRDVMLDLIKEKFGFGRSFVNWPPRSCDLTPLDYFLWGYLKSLVYANKPTTLEELEDNIRTVIASVTPQTLDRVIENWTQRLDQCKRSRGGYLSQVLFHA